MRLQRYGGSGGPLDGEQLVFAPPSTFETAIPCLGMAQDGRLAVAWGARQDGSRARPVRVQRYDVLGQATPPMLEAGANDGGTRPPQPDVAVGPAGDLAVAWRGDDVTREAIRVRRYDAGGNPLETAPLTVAPVDFDASPPPRGPRVARSGDGVVIAWAGLGLRGAARGRPRVFLHRLDPSGLPGLPDDFALETHLASEVTDPAVAAGATGNLLVVWEQDGRIFGQRLASDGRALELPFAIGGSGDGTTVQAMPSVATTPDGQAAVVWRETRDNSTPDVLLRQFRRCGNGNVDPGELCDDGNALAGDCCSPSCQLELDGQACDDGRFCTLGSVCSQGVCGGGTPRDCADTNACTADRCDEPTARCINDATLLDGRPCDDASACTEQDLCAAGSCQGRAITCDDGNACTTDACDPAVGCGPTNADGVSCDDGDQCTEVDVCSQGACAGARICGPDLPTEPGSNPGGGGGSGGGSGTPTLSVTRKGVVKVSCLGPRRATCSGVLFAVAGEAGGRPTPGGQLSKKPKQQRIGKKGQVLLKIKLTKSGRSALGASANRLPALLETTIVEHGGTTRRTSVSAMLVGKAKGGKR